jgi:hypothetical protein
MDAREQIKRLKLETANDRGRALRLAVSAFRAHAHSSPATIKVAAAIEAALDGLDAFLSSFSADPDTDLLTEEELEARIHFATRVLPYLHQILSLVDNADLASVPVELAAPLSVEIRKHLPKADLVVVSATELNYSVVDLAPDIRSILSHLKASPPADFPEALYRASIPFVEYDQALLHCMLAHEIGHPFYQTRRVHEQVLPIEIDEDLLRQLYGQIRLDLERRVVDGQQLTIPFDELSFQSFVTARVNEMIPNWVEEIASDLFGLTVFGPAYLYAFVYFVSSFQLLDDGSRTHPPARIRLRALFGLLDGLFPSGEQAALFSAPTYGFLEAWRQIAMRPLSPGSLFEHVALDTIEKQGVLDRLRTAITGSVDDEHVYTKTRYQEDLRKLLPLIDAHIPPVESIDKSGDQSGFDTVSIFNAAWERLLGGLADLRSALPEAQQSSDFEVRRSYNRFILKSLELSDVVRMWRQAQA